MPVCCPRFAGRTAAGVLLGLVAVLATALALPGCGGRAVADPQPAGSPAAASESPPGDENDRWPDRDAMQHPPFTQRSKAPSLDGGSDWFNAARPVRLSDLRGKFVVLDFWTYCCINCMHMLPELKKLEQKYPNQIVVIGVHSAKFDGERQSDNIARAVERLEIQHPVVNDAGHEIWDRYEIDGWPALRVIDPEGYLVAKSDGEIDFDSLDQFFHGVIPYYRAKKLLDETPWPLRRSQARVADGPLRFPGKVLADEPSGRLYIADSGHNRLVVADLRGKVLDVVGSGLAGAADGDYRSAAFNHPQGMALRGEMLYVADTENHLLRGIDLSRKQVSTLAGTGQEGHGFWPGFEQIRIDPETREPQLPARWVSRPRQARLDSPWALAIHDNWLYIAMAGAHQIWRMSLDQTQLEVYAGTGRENIADGKRVPEVPPRLDRFSFGPFGYASFAQPSGLASDGVRLYVADSEASAIRAVPLPAAKGPPGMHPAPAPPAAATDNDENNEVHTVVGPGSMLHRRPLFTFGDQDAVGDDVRLQHVLGVVYHDGLLYLADTYNNKIKVVDPKSRTARTLVGSTKWGSRDNPPEFNQPGGISVAGGRLFVADTNNHSIRFVELAAPHRVGTLTLAGLSPPEAPAGGQHPSEFQHLRPLELAAATVRAIDRHVVLKVKLALPPGWQLNPLGPMRYRVEERGPLPESLFEATALGRRVTVEPQNRSTDLSIVLPLRAESGRAELTISLAFYYCREGAGGVCKADAVAWRLPLTVSPAAKETVVSLPYRVVP